MKKRILSILLCLVLCLSLMPTVAFAADPVKITKVAVTMPTPVVGASTAISASDVTITTDPADAATINEIYWNTLDETFQADKSYKLIVRFAPKTGYYFEFEDETGVEYYTGDVTFNGQPAFSAYESGSVPGELFATSQSMTPTEAPTPVKITKVEVTGVPTPVAGASTAISADDVTITTVPADAADVVEIHWRNADTGEKDDATFNADNKYFLSVCLAPKDNFCFEFDDTSFKYYTGKATFNDEEAHVAWSYNTDGYLCISSEDMTLTDPTNPTEYDIWVGGVQVTSANKDNILGDAGTPTATYDPETGTLTLNNYDGGAIKAFCPLDIELADGTTNKITVSGESNQQGIYTNNNCDCTIKGSGDLSINLTGSYSSGIYACGDLSVDMAGELTVKAGNYGIATYYSNVNISGSGDVTITADKHGILGESGSLTLSGSGKVSITSSADAAVKLWGTDSKVLLNGTGSPITITAGTGYKAVLNGDTNDSPVGGTNIAYYNDVTGKPEDPSVVYNHTEIGEPPLSVKITKVAVTGIPTPVVGASTAISASDVTITTVPADAYTVDEICWWNTTRGTFASGTFEKDYEYELCVMLLPKDGYCFEFESAFPYNYKGEATINGEAPRSAVEAGAPEGALYISSKPMTPAEPELIPITKVAVTMPTPVVGASTAISADDVTITTEPADAATINEIYWNTLDETFQADKSYKLIVRFAPKTGYYFEFEDETGVEYYTGDVTFNGQPAFSAYESGSVPGELFACSQSMTPTEAPAEPVKITKVEIQVTEPVAGETPDNSVTVITTPGGAATVKENLTWTDDQGQTPDKFEEGKIYNLWLSIAPKDGYQLSLKAATPGSIPALRW